MSNHYLDEGIKKSMYEPFKQPDNSVILGNREEEEEYDNLRYYIAIETNQISIDGTFQNHYLDERIKKAVCEVFAQPNFSVVPGDRKEEEEDDEKRYYRVIKETQISINRTNQNQNFKQFFFVKFIEIIEIYSFFETRINFFKPSSFSFFF